MSVLDNLKKLNQKQKKLIGIATGAVVIVLAAGYIFKQCSGEGQVQGAGLPVDVYEVQGMDVPIRSNLTGRANPMRKAEVRPQVSGIIQKRLFVEGSDVEQGQQLYQIDPSLYQAELDSATANLKSAEATLYTNQLKARRYRTLLNQNAVSKQDYDDAQAAYLQAQAAVDAAKAAQKTAEINLAYTKVYAPISGKIERSNETEGALVSAQQTTPLTSIQQLDPMYVDLGQSVEDHMQLRRAVTEGKVQLSDDKPVVDLYFSNGIKYEHQGTLEFAEATVDETTGMVNLRAVVPNPDHVLLPGMFLRGDLSEGNLTNALVVPQDAITREAGGVAYVYIIDEAGKAQRQDLKIGFNFQNYYVINEGLKQGDKVITSNLQKIRSGSAVVDIKVLAAQKEKAAQENK